VLKHRPRLMDEPGIVSVTTRIAATATRKKTNAIARPRLVRRASSHRTAGSSSDDEERDDEHEEDRREPDQHPQRCGDEHERDERGGVISNRTVRDARSAERPGSGNGSRAAAAIEDGVNGAPAGPELTSLCTCHSC